MTYNSPAKLKRTSRWHVARRISRIRNWIIGNDDMGMGGPPNNFKFSPRYPTRAHGMGTGHLWYSMGFDNDAFDITIWTQYSDEKDEQHMLSMPAEDFRKLAVWYLLRWAFGEWFGLRRWLWYRDLQRVVANIRKAAAP